MRKTPMILSIAGLCMTLLPSFFVMSGNIEWETHSQIMFLGMILWFIFASVWMKQKRTTLK